MVVCQGESVETDILQSVQHFCRGVAKIPTLGRPSGMFAEDRRLEIREHDIALLEEALNFGEPLVLHMADVMRD